MNPPDMVNQKIPFVLYNLGGALLNFITIPVCALLILAFGRVSYNSLFLFFMCVSGFFSALSNGIPMKLGMINNDGYNAKEIAASPEAMKAFWVQMKIVQSASEGVRFKDMPAEWFWLPDENGMKNSMNADIAVFYENRLMDKLLFSEASELIDRLLEEESSIIGLHRHLLICDRLYCELVGEKNIDVINKLYNKEQINFMKRMPNFITVIRTEYVYMLLYAQNVEKAAQIKARFEKFEKVHPYASDVESERELIDTAEQLFYNKKGNQSI